MEKCPVHGLRRVSNCNTCEQIELEEFRERCEAEQQRRRRRREQFYAGETHELVPSKQQE